MTDLDQLRPVRSRFFQNVGRDRGLSLDAKERLVNSSLEGELQLEKIRSDLALTRQREQLNQMRLESGEFELARAREAVRERKDALAATATISERYRELLDDPALSDEAKRKEAARLRLSNPIAFARSPVLREQHSTFERALPQPEEPLSFSDRLRAQSVAMSLAEKAEAAERREEEEKREEAEARAQEFQDRLDSLSRSRPREVEGDFGSKPVDEFENPLQKGEAVRFILEYAADAGVKVPSRSELMELPRSEILEYASQISVKSRLGAAGMQSVGQSSPARSGVVGPLNLP